jgi:plasmid stabilization system protein ParE
VRFHSLEVVLERIEAITEYERDERRAGRGARFDAELRATFQRIALAPMSFTRIHGARSPVLRRARVQRFPYIVVYYLHRGEPVVVAIAHSKRDQGYWRTRLR